MMQVRSMLAILYIGFFSLIQATEIKLYNSVEDLQNLDTAKSVEGKSIELNMAKGEYESFQVLITEGKGSVSISNDLNTLGVKASFRQIETINKIQPTKVWDEAILAQTDQKPEAIKDGEKWYDPLVKYEKFKFDTEGKLRLWITYSTDSNIKSVKNLTDTITFNCSGKKLQIDVKLNIFDVTIPKAHAIPAVFGLSNKIMIKEFGITDKKQLHEIQYKWITELLEFRMDPYICDWGKTEIEGKGHTLHAAYSSPYPANDSRTVKLLKDERLSKFAIPYVLLNDDNYTLKTLNDKELQGWIDSLNANGQIDKGYYYYWDEPMHTDQYRKIGDIADRLRGLWPDCDIVTTFFCGPKEGSCKDDLYSVFKLWAGDTNLYCMSTWALQGKEESAQKCLDLTAGENEEWWVYVCCGPGKPHPNLFCDMTGFSHRAVMWRVWKQKAEGFLYWALNSCEVKDNTLMLREGLPQGDGLVIYPGSLWGKDVSEMVVSVRLERWRDGFEDYELLKMLEETKGRDEALKFLAKIYTNPAEYTNDSTAIEGFKKEILLELEK